MVGLAAVTVGVVAWGTQKSFDPVASAATKSQSAGAANVALTVSVGGPNGSFDVTATGIVDQDQADITTNLSKVLTAAGMPAASGSVELRYLQENGDPVLYLNAPALTAMIPGGKSWVRVDLEQAAKSAGFDPAQMIAQAAQNPADVLAMLQSVGSVQTVGTETLDKVQTTHYKATIDLTKAAGTVSGPAEAAVQRLIARGGPSTVPVDVWIGADGLVRKVDVDETISNGGQSASAHTTLTLSNYGTAANVTAPASDQTLDVTGLLAMAAQRLPAGSHTFIHP